MATRLVVDEQNRLQEIKQEDASDQPLAVRWVARIISYIFHPAFVPVYLVAFMVYGHPYIFAGFSPFDKQRAVIMAVVMYAFFPLVTVGLLKALKFIEGVQLKTQKDRVIPLVACGIWYFWIWYVWHNLPDYPRQAVLFTLAAWISVSLALLANIIMKISLHAIAMGVMLGFIILSGFSESLHFGFYISIALLITGLVCTSRFIDSNHTAQEIYGGLVLGALSQMVAWWVG